MDKKLLLCEFLFLLFISASAQHPVIGGYNVYYGCLHNHSNVSDGSGTPATAYNYAKNISHLDFFGLSDHSYSISSDEWEDIQSQADNYNEDGVFTSFYGFEWSADGTYGHITVVNTADYCSTDSPTNSLNGLSSWLSARSGGVAFFNHPGRDTYNTIEFGYFASSPSDQFVGIELWNSGNGFSTYYYNDGYYSGDNNKSFIDEANERGWKLGASGSEDNHSGTWGAYSQYRLAVLSNSLTRPALLDAIRERRFFSTLDKNIALSFKINGMEMGSSLAGGNYTARIQAVDADGETFNQVILFNRNHDIVNQWSLNSGNINVTANLTTFDGDYYYVKVRQADGDEAISSPIWISGGSSNQHPVCSITTPPNGSTFSAPAIITIGANASDSDGSVTKVEFYQGSTKIGEDISAPYSISWSGVSAGNYSLTVRATDNAGSTATSLPVSVTVNARSITVRADSQTKVYGRSDPELTYEVVSGSLMGSDTFRGVLSREPGENVGEYSINQGTLNLNDNYIITFLESSFTITERPVTVTAESKNENFGRYGPRSDNYYHSPAG